MQTKPDISFSDRAVSLFQSTKNTRPLPVGDARYIRSDVPTAVTEGERCLLLALGITLVIDLRTEGERAAKPCPLAEDARFTYECYPIRGGDTVPPSPAAVPRSYIKMVDATFRAAVARILQAEGGVLYFCNAGKDRTGALSAALLYHLGADDETIVSDYMRSRTCLAPVLAAYAEKCGLDINVITPCEEYIRGFLSWYRHLG